MAKTKTVTIYGIPNCDTMKKARAWLDAHGVGYRFHDYRAEGVERKELASWVDALGWEKVLNRASTTFKSLAEGKKENLDRDKAIALMIANPTMIKRPMLDVSGSYIAGFKPDIYGAIFPA
ncbi:MAG: ArsC family reductase [Alphaproteobacteria bacterium]|nr:ArsC family reductase [Alphaproteobacteria bacterium]